MFLCYVVLFREMLKLRMGSLIWRGTDGFLRFVYFVWGAGPLLRSPHGNRTSYRRLLLRGCVSIH